MQKSCFPLFVFSEALARAPYISLVIRSIAAFLLGAVLITSTHSALAQCVLSSFMVSYICSGHVGTLTIDSSVSGPSEFFFQDGTTGRLILIADPLDFQWVDFGDSRSNVTIDLSNQTGYQTIYAGLDIWFLNFTDTFIGGSQGKSRIIGTAGDNEIYGGPLNDIIHGGSGNDIMYGFSGKDTIYGGPGDDVLKGSLSNDWLQGEEGNDIHEGHEGDDTMEGGEGDDHFIGFTGLDTIDGGSGNDIVIFLYKVSECMEDVVTNAEDVRC